MLNNTYIILGQVVWLYLNWRVSCDFYMSRDGWSTSTMQSEWPCPQPCLTSTCWKHFKQRYVNITILKHISHAPFSYRLISTWTHTYILTHKTKYIHLHDIYIVATPLDDDRDREVQEYLLAARNIYSGLLIISVTTHDDPEQRTSTGFQIKSWHTYQPNRLYLPTHAGEYIL